MKQVFRLGGRAGWVPAEWRSSRALRWVLLALAALVALYVAVNWSDMQLRAQMATGFGARIACSCRYIEGRDLNSCQSDFKGLEGMGLVRLRDDPEAKLVRASVPLMASRSATFKPGFGCLPDKG